MTFLMYVFRWCNFYMGRGFKVHRDNSYQTKFTMEYSYKEVNSFGCFVSKNKDNNQPQSTLFEKPSYMHQFLYVVTCQQVVYILSILHSQTIRLKKNCSNADNLKLKLFNLEQCLINKTCRSENGYSQIHKVNTIGRKLKWLLTNSQSKYYWKKTILSKRQKQIK